MPLSRLQVPVEPGRQLCKRHGQPGRGKGGRQASPEMGTASCFRVRAADVDATAASRQRAKTQKRGILKIRKRGERISED